MTELVAIGGQLTQLVNHMFAHESPPAVADPIPVVLTRLFAETFDHSGRFESRDDLAAAARVLRAACEVIESEIYLVAPPNRAQRRHRRRRPS